MSLPDPGQSIIVENRRWVEGTEETRVHAKYFCVLVQYVTAFSADKVGGGAETHAKHTARKAP